MQNLLILHIKVWRDKIFGHGYWSGVTVEKGIMIRYEKSILSLEKIWEISLTVCVALSSRYVRRISDDPIQFDIGFAHDDITEVAHMGL